MPVKSKAFKEEKTQKEKEDEIDAFFEEDVKEEEVPTKGATKKENFDSDDKDEYDDPLDKPAFMRKFLKK
jgi:hypothetical protein